MPTLLIENKAMYADWYCPKIKEGFQLLKSSQEIPDILIEPDSDSIDITFIAYGGTVKLIKEACEKLFFDYDLICQALLVTKIYPFNISPYLAKIQRSKKIILFEEGQGFAGFASEVISQLAEYGSLDKVKVKRVFAKEICIPSSGVLEKKVLPDLQDLINAAID